MSKEYIFFFFVSGIGLLTLLAISLTAMLVIFKQKQVRHKNELLKTRLDVQEQSMTLISEEIHDNIGQLLSLARMYMQSLSQKEQDPQNLKLVKECRELLSRAIVDLRYISHSLNGERIEQIGLVASIERELEHIESASGIDCVIQVTGKAYQLTREQDLLLFRVLQEAIQNVIKHAEATRLVIHFNYEEDQLKVHIQDSGKGFDVQEVESKGTLGLRNIKNRLNLLNATFELQSIPGYGTDLSFTIPNYMSYGKNQHH